LAFLSQQSHPTALHLHGGQCDDRATIRKIVGKSVRNQMGFYPFTRRLVMNLILAVVLLLFVVTPASAEWIGEVYGGFAKTGNNTLKDTSSLGLTAKFHDVNFDASGTFGARGGYWFNELGGIAAYGMGLDVFHFGADIDQQSVPVQVGGLSTTATLQPLEVSVIGVGLDIVKVRLHLSKSEQFPNGQLQPYVTAGPAIFHSRLKDSNNVMPNNQRESDTSLGVKIGLGLQYLIGPNVGLFGEYRFTHFKAEGSFQDTTLPASTETLSANFNTHHLTGGISFHF
jgi:opacity protein-like surface antigen